MSVTQENKTVGGRISRETAGMRQAWQSKLVSFDANGRLVYQSDAEGNRIPDFSYAGYHNRERRLPDVPTVETISPIPGDNTSHIQAAIDAAGQRPVGPDGFRGVVLLQAGEYEVAGTIRLNHSGVVLRGAGDGANPATDTLLRAVGNTPAERDVIVVGSGLSTRWAGEVSGTRTNITSSFVPVASRTFTVASAGALRVGDNVIIVHPCTQDWLDAIDGGGTATDPPWRVDEQPDMAFGFQLRPDSSEAARQGMLDTLRAAFNRDRRVRLDYSQTGPTTGIIIRVADLS